MTQRLQTLVGDMREREQLFDLLTRLVRIRDELGEVAFDDACNRSRLAIAHVALKVALREAPTSNRCPQDKELTIRATFDPE